MIRALDYVVYLFVLLFFKTVGLLPRKAALFIGAFCGAALYYTRTLRYSLVIHNIRTAFPDKQPRDVKELARKFYINFGKIIMELPTSYNVSSEFVDNFIEFEGTEFFERVLKEGKGLVILTAHFGNWELLGSALGVKGYNVNTTYRALDNPYLDKFLLSQRSMTGNSPIEKSGAVRRLMGMSKTNEIIGMLMDQRSSFKESIIAEFMGEKVRTNKGLAMVAVRNRSENITPVFIVREGLKYKIIIERALKLKETGNRDKDVLENTELFNRVIAGYIEKYPDQWLWLHSRFDRRKRLEI